MRHIFGCILTDKYVTQQRFILDPRPSAEFSGNMRKFLGSLADFLSALAFFCYHYIFDSYVTS